MLKVMLIEDSPKLQDLLGGVLSAIDGVAFFGAAASEDEALRMLAQNTVDLLIVDINLKQGSGIGVLGALRANPVRFGTPRKVVFTNHAHASMQRRCEALGADAFFDKSMNVNGMLAYVREAAASQS